MSDKSDKKITFQIHHKTNGVYQGQFMGLGFWHLISNAPEQGLCEFPTRVSAIEHVVTMVRYSGGNSTLADYMIEPFDQKLSDALIKFGNAIFEQKPVLQ